MSTLKVNSIEPANVGQEDYFVARSWANFTGIVLTVNNSGNVTSMTDNGVGDFSVNFTTPMADALYCFTGTADTNTANCDDVRISLLSSNATRFIVQAGATKADPAVCTVATIR